MNTSSLEHCPPSYPFIDYARRPTQPPKISKRVRKFPALYQLSGEFFGAETNRDFATEFCFFTLIACVSIWPIVSMLVAVMRLSRGY